MLVGAVALAAADSAIVVLAVPRLLREFGRSIPSTAWVVTGYNLAAAITALLVLVVAGRLRTRLLLTAGLLVFAAAGVGCALAASHSKLANYRVVH
jgi:predicted MFS family arabinose efflux permease